MPVSYSVLNGGNLVIECWTGPISHEELLAHEHQQINDQSIHPRYSILVDATGAEFETTLEKIQEMTDFYQTSTRAEKVKCALLVSEEAYQLAMRFANQAKGYGIRVILFASLEVACIWLGIDPKMAMEELAKLRRGMA